MLCQPPCLFSSLFDVDLESLDVLSPPMQIHSNQKLLVIDPYIKSSLIIASICFWKKDWQFGTVHRDYWTYLFINWLSNRLVCQWHMKPGHY